MLDRHVLSGARCTIPHARALGVLLRSIIVEREPIYPQQETVHGFARGSSTSGPTTWRASAMISSAALWIGCLMDYIERAGGRFVTVMPLATARKTPSFASGSKPTHPIGSARGTAPIHAVAMGRATAGTSTGLRCRLPKPGPSFGSGARCSPHARKPGGAET